MRILDIIERLLPRGTDRTGLWDKCPLWPPDVFAVAATLVKASGCYSRERTSQFAVASRRAGIRWRTRISPPRVAERCWSILLKHGQRRVAQSRPDSREWWRAALQLVAISDEASRGIGFAMNDLEITEFSTLVLEEYRQWIKGSARWLSAMPHSLCLRVSPFQACVQPKSRTPQVGCTVNSLTHHLALLPSIGEVKTTWHHGLRSASLDDHLNLLLVPFPYRISDSAFVARGSLGRQGRYFTIKPTWLEGISARLFGEYLCDLVKQAQEHVDRVHGIILPEGALSLDMAKDVASILKGANLEFFISGAVSGGRKPKNLAYTSISYGRNEKLHEMYQSKRHRWKLNGSQIRRYDLADKLSPPDHKRGWWEDIDVAPQDSNALLFTVFRPGASMAVLICEDLARIEPVQPALRAIGPNLVVVPLLDGSQREDRWSARYAMSLADDPGSAVLTLTALGMIHRDWKAEPLVGLWRDPEGAQTRKLMLPWGAHALLLKLKTSGVRNYTLDSRSDLGNTVSLSLDEKNIWPITHPGTKRISKILGGS